ncbi:MAG TPA: zf-HC2 domain-containing protein, partial [Polyangiaceae bacterium]|nr:zf-HC2 domain-containing protein [Polyangiaceae bacterium]
MALRSDAPGSEGGETFRSGAGCLEPDEAAGFAQGLLAGDELARVEAHIDRCADCRRYVSDLARASASGDPAGAPGPTSIAYGAAPDTTAPPDPEGPTVPVGPRPPPVEARGP